MDKIKRMLLVNMPGSACNLRCEYCYITNQNLWNTQPKKMDHSPQEIANALSKKRLGGVCFINLCGSGETLLPKDSVAVIKALLEEGHYIEVVTNGTLSTRFDEIATFPSELLQHLTFKFSFHYEQLKKRKMIEEYFQNVYKMHNAGCSFTVEMTPYDGIEDEKEEILNTCINYLGSPCHCTIARDDTKEDIPVMSKRDLHDYCDFWSDFHSAMMDFKKQLFGVERKEFCYAGLYSLNIRLSTGDYSLCYGSPIVGNIYSNIDKPIPFKPIGKCPVAHCYNGHAHLALGLIPSLDTPSYFTIRNIHLKDGTNSISETFESVFKQRITNNFPLLSNGEEKKVYMQGVFRRRIILTKRKTIKVLKRLGVNKIYHYLKRK